MDALRAWSEHDPPPGSLLVAAASFGSRLEDDPVVGAELEHGTLFFQVVPGTEHDGWIVALTYELTSLREVRCQTFSCVQHPQKQLLPTWPVPKHHQAD
jgi:hypothetical protein